jgi:hypothetical protein
MQDSNIQPYINFYIYYKMLSIVNISLKLYQLTVWFTIK